MSDRVVLYDTTLRDGTQRHDAAVGPGADGGFQGVHRFVAPQGLFHAPHGLSVGPDGSIFVAEFVTGGRLVRLAPA